MAKNTKYKAEYQIRKLEAKLREFKEVDGKYPPGYWALKGKIKILEDRIKDIKLHEFLAM